jgi:hypothetical protein
MNAEEVKKLTTEKFYNPKVGDRFQEMYSFWMYIVHIEKLPNGRGNVIYTAHFHPPCEVNAQSAEIHKHFEKGLRNHYFYGSSERLKEVSWLMYCDHKPEHIEGLFDEYVGLGKPIHDEHAWDPHRNRLEKVGWE